MATHGAASRLSWCILIVAGCSPSHPTLGQGTPETAPAPAAPEAMAGSAEAIAIVDALEERFSFSTLEPAAEPLQGPRHGALVALPARANESFRVTDERSGMSMEAALEGAAEAPAEMASGHVVYREAYGPGGHVIHRVTAEGTEDFVAFEQAPAEAAVRYALSLGEGVRGIRLVESTLELLDAEGVPRLRVAPPYLVDRDGRRHGATLQVEGCAADTDPAPPWGRAVTAPGAEECTVRIAWDAGAVAYPALLDPVWTATGSMATARGNHTASVLSDGHVLVAGGENSGGRLSSAELYDPVTETWSATGNMLGARTIHTATVLSDGRVLVAGGIDTSSYSLGARIYNPASGMWIATGPMTTPRALHTASVLPDGHVLVVGGTSDGMNVLSSAELCDPVAGTWSAAPAPGFSGLRHTATVLSDGRILVAGGSATLYDPAMGTWTPTGSMVVPRNGHTANLLSNGKVLVAGGDNAGGNLKSAELYDPASGTWSVTGNMVFVAFLHDAVGLSDGRVLEVPSGSSAAQIYDPSTGTWALTANMTETRRYSTASVLPDGRVLVTGGEYPFGSFKASAELFDLKDLPLGAPCGQAIECASGFCVDAVCCDAACGGNEPEDCRSCNVAGTVGTCVVVAAGTECRAAAGDCDVAETCDGSSVDCPVDEIASAGTECRAAVDDCDAAEVCNGSSVDCPGDLAAPAGTECRAAVGDCDVAEICNGVSLSCPVDEIVSAGTECRAAAGECDVAESCDGASGLCPPDEHVADGAACDGGDGVCQAGVCELPGTGGGGAGGGSGGGATGGDATGGDATSAGGTGGVGGEGGAGGEGGGGCGCRAAGSEERRGADWISVLGLAAIVGWARRRRVGI